MKMTAALLIMMLLCMANTRAEESTLEVTSADKEVVSQQLEKEADQHEDSKTRLLLKKVSEAFKASKDSIEVGYEKIKGDCANCSREEKTKGIFKRLGMSIGKGAAWLSTTTAKPFMATAGFIKGSVEKEEKNKDLAAFYQFFLNNQEKYDDLYLQAGTPEEMIDLMIAKTEEILDQKTNSIMKDFLFITGVKADMPDNFSRFDLTPEELSRLDVNDLNLELINQHPEYLELKPLLGELTKEDIQSILTTGKFNKSIAQDKYKAAIPTIYEAAGSIVGQIYAPRIALGVVSSTLASLYTVPVVAADVATGVSVAVCSQPETKEKLSKDKELRSFCSYVTNRTGYELMKSRAKGYVSGKKFHSKVVEKYKEAKEKWKARREKKALEKQQKEIEQKTELL
ncbi:hypothetical protein [Peredibacter starrii]|uniref:Uncharacterized protein n=1 Tax=Peredibacter starrii TaxID=28202 RepID=A0AAX4HLI3_9BACT|nr:hypothetical protein [Peredibacter starrii]WPU63993.1 hypothetical protein SOO65_14955 [Peredibacter starrii]